MDLIISLHCSCRHENIIHLDISQTAYFCDNCGKEVFRLRVHTGYIYLLSNPSMPGLVKVGYTERNVEERVFELNNTGIPLPFVIEAIWGSSSPLQDEKAIHGILASYRIASNREFFSLDMKIAVEIINGYLTDRPIFLRSPELLMSADEMAANEEKRKRGMAAEEERRKREKAAIEERRKSEMAANEERRKKEEDEQAAYEEKRRREAGIVDHWSAPWVRR